MPAAPRNCTQDQKYNPEQMQYHNGISGGEEQRFHAARAVQ